MIVHKVEYRNYHEHMKTVVLAGGYGTRLAEESSSRPKPMIEIGGMPILWHIMKHYYYYEHREFIIAANFANMGGMISDFFLNYAIRRNDIKVYPHGGEVTYLSNRSEDWIVSIVDTGDKTETAGRLKRLKGLIGTDDFLVTYGDGVSDVDINQVINYHKSHGKVATMCVTNPATRFGCLEASSDGAVSEFVEKPFLVNQLVNIGYFVFKNEFFDYVHSDSDSLSMLDRLAKDNQLMAFKHTGFWQCMDTLADMRQLRKMYAQDSARWVLW